MEVKIGVIDSPRELIVNSEQTPDEVETLVAAVLGGREPVLALVADKGRKFLVQASRVAYVEIGPSAIRKVGVAPPPPPILVRVPVTSFRLAAARVRDRPTRGSR